MKARGFAVGNIDPCLFIHPNIICIIYVDDCLFFAYSHTIIDNMIEDFHQDFQLKPETDIMAFLGIKIVHNETTDEVTLIQPTLI